MPAAEFAHNSIKDAIRQGEIGLQGPSRIPTDLIGPIDYELTHHVKEPWDRVDKVTRLMAGLSGQTVEAPKPLPLYFTDALRQHVHHLIIGHTRLEKSPPEKDQVLDSIPGVIEDFCAINGILGFTQSDFKRKRHPATMFSPEAMKAFADTASEAGYAPVYIKIMAMKRDPDAALDEANQKLELLRNTGQDAAGSNMKLAVTRIDPTEVAKKRRELEQQFSAAYEGDTVVKLSDIRDTIDAYRPERVASALAEFRQNVIRLLFEHTGQDPLIDLRTIRAACRRASNPDENIQRIKDRFTTLMEHEPDLEPEIARYLARTYANPLATLRQARELISSDPFLGASAPRRPKNALWVAIQDMGRLQAAVAPLTT